MKKLKALKNKKGFTLIELLTVIAILGILVLLAAPKFLGHTAQANETRAKADIKTFETTIASKLALDQNITKNWPEIEKTKLEDYRENGSLFAVEGKIKSDYQFNESYLDIPEEDFKKEFKSKLSGNFIMDSDGKIYYHDETLIMGNDKNDSVNDNDEDENTVVKEPEFTSEEHFTWVKDSSGYFTAENPTEKGYYKYTQTGEELVTIPHVINGTEMTSYYKMFENSDVNVKKVISTNPKVTDMSKMFYESKATSLDLSEFNTSNVTNMDSMFLISKATSLDLSNWNTSKVKNMNAMFFRTLVTTLNLSSFDTSNVTNMSQMFSQAKTTELDLSSFDTSNVTNMSDMFNSSESTSLNLSSFVTSNVTDMSYMFKGAKAPTLDLSSFDTSKTSVNWMNYMFTESEATKGYAKTQEDANKFNSSIGKSTGFTFTLKK